MLNGDFNAPFDSCSWAVRAEYMQLCLQIHAPSTDKKFRVVVTKDLPGDRWLQTLLSAGCQVDICKHSDTILSQDIIKKLIAAGETHGVLGQLTEV